MALMDMIHRNLKHDSLSHNKGYSQSKTDSLASNHTNNYNQEQESRRHHKRYKLWLRSQRRKEKKRTL